MLAKLEKQVNKLNPFAVLFAVAMIAALLTAIKNT